MKRLAALALVVTLAGLLVACGDDDDSASSTTAPEATTTSQADTSTTAGEEEEGEEGEEVSAEVGDTDLGETLVYEGQTMYVFDMDTEGTIACVDACVDIWPPVSVEGEPVAGEGVDQSLLGTVDRDDGTTQLTVDGRPVYTFTGDQAPGDATGDGNGGVWHALTPEGAPFS